MNKTKFISFWLEHVRGRVCVHTRACQIEVAAGFSAFLSQVIIWFHIRSAKINSDHKYWWKLRY